MDLNTHYPHSDPCTAYARMSNFDTQLCPCSHCVCIHFHRLPSHNSKADVDAEKIVSACMTGVSVHLNEP